MVLFIVAADIIECLFVYLNAVSGQNLYIFYYHLIIRMVEVVLIALGAHIAGNVTHGAVNALILRTLRKRLENATYLLAVVLKTDKALRVAESARRRLQFLARRQWVRRVYI